MGKTSYQLCIIKCDLETCIGVDMQNTTVTGELKIDLYGWNPNDYERFSWDKVRSIVFVNGKNFIFDQNKMKYVFIGKNYKVLKMVENSQSFKSITLYFPWMETIMNKGKYFLFAIDIAKSI